MKKILFVLLLIPLIALGQNTGTFTFSPDSVGVVLTDSDTTYIWVSWPNEFDYVNNTSWPIIIEDATGSKPSNLFIPYSGETYWNGNFYVGVYINCAADSCVDSLQVSWSPYDDYGRIYTNDVRYLKFSDGTASSSVDWFTSGVNDGCYGAASNGQTVPTSGVRFTIIQHDTSCVDTVGFKIWKN
jgi:hypothetical protein